jgi:Fe-S-cluster-containing hydrogenase component 2
MICSFYNAGIFSPSLSKVTVDKIDELGMDYPIFCRQCPECPPIQECPTKALQRNENGVVFLEKIDCIGCGNCVTACLFKAIKMADSKPVICDLCGGNPICAKRCPTNALVYEESEFFSETPIEAFKNLSVRWRIDA